MNGSTQKALIWCCGISAWMVLFPPLQYVVNGTGDGYGFLFDMQPYHRVNLMTLLVQLLLVWFLGGTVVLINGYNPQKVFHASGQSTKIASCGVSNIIMAYWSGNRPLTPGFYYIGIFGITAVFTYCSSHVELISDALHVEKALAYIAMILSIIYVIWAWVVIWRCSRPKKSLDRFMTRLFVFLYLCAFLLIAIQHNNTYLEKVNRPVLLDDLKLEGYGQ